MDGKSSGPSPQSENSLTSQFTEAPPQTATTVLRTADPKHRDPNGQETVASRSSTEHCAIRWDSTVSDWNKQEKGVDVLTALDAYRKAVQGTYDVVILASHDTDLIPVLETYDTDRNESSGRLETTGWQGCKRLKARGVTT